MYHRVRNSVPFCSDRATALTVDLGYQKRRPPNMAPNPKTSYGIHSRNKPAKSLTRQNSSN